MADQVSERDESGCVQSSAVPSVLHPASLALIHNAQDALDPWATGCMALGSLLAVTARRGESPHTGRHRRRYPPPHNSYV